MLKDMVDQAPTSWTSRSIRLQRPRAVRCQNRSILRSRRTGKTNRCHCPQAPRAKRRHHTVGRGIKMRDTGAHDQVGQRRQMPPRDKLTHLKPSASAFVARAALSSQQIGSPAVRNARAADSPDRPSPKPQPLPSPDCNHVPRLCVVLATAHHRHACRQA